MKDRNKTERALFVLSGHIVVLVICEVFQLNKFQATSSAGSSTISFSESSSVVLLWNKFKLAK